jgi:hypothetical protein
MRIRRARTVCMLAVPALLTAAIALDAVARQPRGGRGPKVIRGRTVTDKGNWHGTWTYVSREGKMALWLDTSGDRIRAKVQYQGTSRPEGFISDWDGDATYIFAGEPGTFDISITEAHQNRIDGTWFWDVQFKSVGRSERGTFSLYRVGDGRQMLMDFSEYERVLRKGENVSRYDGAMAWNFRKVSKRIALWDEVF